MDATSRVSERVSQMSDQIIDLASRLVAIPTENPPGRHYADCISLLTSELSSLDLAHEVIEVPGDVENPRLILLSGIGSGPTFFLHGQGKSDPDHADGAYSGCGSCGDLSPRHRGNQVGAGESVCTGKPAPADLYGRDDGLIDSKPEPTGNK